MTTSPRPRANIPRAGFSCGSAERRKAARSDRLFVADAGSSVRRVRRHFADAQERILTDRFGASSFESGLSQVGHNPTFMNDRFSEDEYSMRGVGRKGTRHRLLGGRGRRHHGICSDAKADLRLRTGARWQGCYVNALRYPRQALSFEMPDLRPGAEPTKTRMVAGLLAITVRKVRQILPSTTRTRRITKTSPMPPLGP